MKHTKKVSTAALTDSLRLTWRQYESGKEYKRSIGLYERVRTNERFYRGEQWQSGEGKDLPRPVFNIVRRVMDFLICSIASTDLRIRFTDEQLPFLPHPEDAERMDHGLQVLSSHAAYRWEKCGMDAKLLRMLTDCAITGDGVIYCYWDPSVRTPQPYKGDIATEIIDNVHLFVSDVNRSDLQSQDYLILSGRASVASLRSEARESGCTDGEIAKILPDGCRGEGGGDLSRIELNGEEGEEKATYLLKFYRENGFVVFEKSTRDCMIRRAVTPCRLYPVAYMNWIPTKGSFHGSSPMTALIPNQKFINRAYAMAMKHMTDTAFSKVIYDKSKIPEWTNEVGEAIAAIGGGNVSDAVSVLGVGEMQSGYTELIDSAVNLTKELMGATDSALGNIEANNTSAILALQETSRIPLQQVRTAYYRCVEELANIWADMMCAYYPSERLLPYLSGDEIKTDRVDFELLREGFLSAHVDVSEVTRYTAVSVQNLLDKLLDGGYISPSAYVRRLPSGILYDRDSLLEELDAPSSRPSEDQKE